MRYYVSWKTTGYYRKDSLKMAARSPVSGCWPSCSCSVGCAHKTTPNCNEKRLNYQPIYFN